MPGRPVTRTDRAAHLVVRMRRVRSLAALDGRRLKDALYPQRDVVNDAGLSADGDRSFQELLMKAGVRLGCILASALVMQGQVVQPAHDGLQIGAGRAL